MVVWSEGRGKGRIKHKIKEGGKMKKMLKLPNDVESNCLGSGCPNNCWYCHEPKEVIYNGIPELLGQPDPKQLLSTSFGSFNIFFIFPPSLILCSLTLALIRWFVLS